MTYGYRYTPGSRVFELPGLGLLSATAEVEHRRTIQRKHGNRETVELCELTPDGWHPVRQSIPAKPAPQARHQLPPDPGDISRLAAAIAALPQRSGRSRRRR
ncbi:hypothetical protein [Nocardia neocaledoniensis]|uniref:hypothetical protein n=1 Tax=Nocardia neocaledoniensis TaxID=236511 RepID=UPI00245815D2|nr:hypothetical protein [Nocardia neocaledoniensis]